MTTDPTSVTDQIRAILAAAEADDAPNLERLEEVLTAGYARALALEGERLQLERELAERAAALAEGTERAHELAGLAQRMSAADGDLLRLRTALASLRERTASVRAADAVPNH